MDLKKISSKLDEKAATLITFIVIYLFLVFFFSPKWMLLKTTTTGGDMGSHYVLAQYLRDYLLPHHKLVGWYPHWLAGMPMLQYYFIPPYLLMVLLGYFISLEISFKLVTVLGVFLLPIATYYGMKAMDFKFPQPIIAASFSLIFLFLENYSQWGGNIKSTLAGQFPHGISIAFTILFMGLAYRTIEVRTRKHLIISSIVLALVILHHVYTTVIVVITSSFLFLLFLYRKKFDGIVYLTFIFVIGFMLAGFWVIPMLLKLGSAAATKDVWYVVPNLNWIFIPELTVFYVFAIIGVVASILKRDTRIFYLIYSFILVFGLLFVSKYTNFLYIRFIPHLYLLSLIFAAQGISILTESLKGRSLIPMMVVFAVVYWIGVGVDDLPWISDIPGVGEWSAKSVKPWVEGLPCLKDNLKPILGDQVNQVPCFGSIVSPWFGPLTENPYVSHGVRDVPHWIKWNYEGLESKNTWPLLHDILSYVAETNVSGRIDFEYGDYNYFGTPRVFEASPVFTNKSVMEALLLESSLTFPFFYFLQREVSETAWWPGFNIELPNFNLSRGIKHLRLYNVKIYVASSDIARKAASQMPELTLEKSFERFGKRFEVYRLNEDSQYVEPLKKEPVLVVTDDWRKYAFQWISFDEYVDVPFVFTSEVGEYELENFRLVIVNKSVDLPPGGIQVFGFNELSKSLGSSGDLGGECTVVEDFHEEIISFNTTCVGRPHLVKVSYYPNWKVDGAKKIYLASPSLMVLIPEKTNVTLYYGWTFPDALGIISSILALLVLFLLAITKEFRWPMMFLRKK